MSKDKGKSKWTFPVFHSTPKLFGVSRGVLRDAGIFVVEHSTIDFYPWQRYYLKEINPEYYQNVIVNV